MYTQLKLRHSPLIYMRIGEGEVGTQRGDVVEMDGGGIIQVTKLSGTLLPNVKPS
jgi:hypothetical protein